MTNSNAHNPGAADGPLISVVVPVYNVEDYLEECVESIRAQTYRNTEIILVNDGSTDRSAELCREYARKDERIIVAEQSNSGLSQARNRGIETAKGEYIAFVDSDDYIAPEMLSRLYGRMAEDGSDLALCGYWTVDENRKPLVPCRVRDGCLSGMEALSMLSSNEFRGVAFGIACNKLYRKDLFDGIRFPPGKYHEDVFTLHLLLDRSAKVSVVDDYLYFYRQRGNSITKEGYSVRHLDGVEGFYRRYCYYRSKGEGYQQLLQGAGQDVATAFYQSKIRYRPKTGAEKERVKEINRMAREVCLDRFWKWSAGMKVKLLAPHVLFAVSSLKKRLRRSDHTAG